MKKFFVWAFALIIGIVFAVPGFAEDNNQSEATNQRIQSETPARSQKLVKKNKVTKKKHQKKETSATPADGK